MLGVVWNPSTDTLQFKVNDQMSIGDVTKRTITSEVAKLFDPTGLLAPFIVLGRALIREMWMDGISWDKVIKGTLSDTWMGYRASMKAIEHVKIPRWIGTSKTIGVELHGFAGATIFACVAAVYYRTIKEDGTVHCGLLSSKTKIAPVRKITPARLSLTSCVLLTELMTSVKATFDTKVSEMSFWTDSDIALTWIEMDPSTVKQYVSNRVKIIHGSAAGKSWNYLPSDENPASIAVLGMDAHELVDCNLWWQGPKWLPSPRTTWSKYETKLSSDAQEIIRSEMKAPIVAAVTIDQFWIAGKYSDFSKLCLVTAYVQRYVKKLKQAVESRKLGTPMTFEPIVNGTAPIERVQRIQPNEWNDATNFWLKKIQQHSFAAEIRACSANESPLPRGSKLLKTAPFLDKNKLLRVGGRLKNALVPFDVKHPIILPGDSILVKQIIRRQHLSLYHGGCQVTERVLREKYWIVGGRNAIRHEIYKCTVCKRLKKQVGNQQMAPLIDTRVLPVNQAFTHISVDYCGPFDVRRFVGRCNTTIKVWVAVFICMATRAIHLQVVNDLTTDAFIDAYLLMAARRGHPRSITADNAKCFRGAERKMIEIARIFEQSAQHKEFVTRQITWHFIMPRSPAQGGSHESAVKLFKHHLKRSLKNHTLAYPMFVSLVTRIEPCLNSRPLGLLRDDPTDDVPLTPAHFLINGPFEHVPVEPAVEEEKSLTNKWRKLQALHQGFWRRWQSDYINHLAGRSKWYTKEENLKVNDVVLLKDDNAPPMAWLLGRIAEIHPGRDGLVRNLTIQTKTGKYQRAVQRVCPLLRE